jgi:hypothetical protein
MAQEPWETDERHRQAQVSFTVPEQQASSSSAAVVFVLSLPLMRNVECLTMTFALVSTAQDEDTSCIMSMIHTSSILDEEETQPPQPKHHHHGF